MGLFVGLDGFMGWICAAQCDCTFLVAPVKLFYIQYPRPVVDCAPNVTADRPAHWSVQSTTGRGYCLNVIGVLLCKSTSPQRFAFPI